jgi:hypothetical protein
MNREELVAVLKETRGEPGLSLDDIAKSINEVFDAAEVNYLMRTLIDLTL